MQPLDVDNIQNPKWEREGIKEKEGIKGRKRIKGEGEGSYGCKIVYQL